MPRENTPHAVYYMYNRKMELLYVGCSRTLLSSIDRVLTPDPVRNYRMWATEVAAVKVLWYPTRTDGERAEAAAIVAHKPLHNRYRHGMPNRAKAACPRCGNPKQKSTAAYCADCAKAYRRDRYLRMRAGTWHTS